ncbi:hypothetical protein OS965_42335 [Streptomyces sp. H27-G5]|uniref:hypothetical protein n=1 Tax=Streptomyces sp. H27-G5 TaxID=2996698 RepID=UPI002271F468|nr:hypothetical protein [Streptomyces sp. H27-G5]MCY0924623.1 hypothetical protein [Streptomyces sp. H27-G5]
MGNTVTTRQTRFQLYEPYQLEDLRHLLIAHFTPLGVLRGPEVPGQGPNRVVL